MRPTGLRQTLTQLAVFWIVVGLSLFVLPVGGVAVLVLCYVVWVSLAARDRHRADLLERPDDLRRAGEKIGESSHPVHRGSGLDGWMRR